MLSVFNEVDHELLSVLEKYCENCDICKRYKPMIPRPAVGNLYDPSKLTFNSIVTVDLKEWIGKYIMYIIDLFSRYTRADFIQSKCKDVAVSKISELWFPIFGNFDMFLIDNGGEFGNDTKRELGNFFGINIKHTAGYSPWSNDVNKRNHANVNLILTKMLEDLPNLDERMALQYCISVKNCCMYIQGYNPAQIVIGKNPKFPSVTQDELSALEENTRSPIIAQQLNAISAARKSYIEVDLSSKLRKALKHPVSPYSDIIYRQNDTVYRKLPHKNRWQGSAIVIEQDNKIVIVKHGNIIRRVHPCNLQLKTPKEIIVRKENEMGSKATSLNTESNQQNIIIPTNKSENNDDEQFILDENLDDVNNRAESSNNTENILKQSANRIESIPLSKHNGKQLTC